jgi:F-type H+-transporting ATPase subunit b
VSRAIRSRRLVLAAFVVALLGLVATIAFAQDHGTLPRRAPTGHGAPVDRAAGTAEPGAQSGEHRSDPASGEHGEAAEHGEHAGGGHHGPEPINWTDIWDTKRPAFLALAINFGVLLTLYYMLGKKPVAEALKQRRVTVGKEIDEAQALLEEAKERAKKYQAELNSAEADASTAKAGLISAGKGEVDRLLREAQERADRMRRDADRLVEQERKQMQIDLHRETVDLAVREAAQILEKSVTADDHARLAQDLLAELSSRPGARDASVARAGNVRPQGGAGAGGGAT